MKDVTDPRRWLDPGSNASDGLRRLLTEGRDALGPSGPQLKALAGRLGPLMGPPPPAPNPGAPGAPRIGQTLAKALTKGAVTKIAVAAIVGGGAVGAFRVVNRPPSVHETQTISVSRPSFEAGTASPPVPASSPAASELIVPTLPPAAPPDTDESRSASPSIEVFGQANAPPMPPPRANPPPNPNVRSTAPGPTELELLSRARAQVQTDPRGALDLLDQHATLFEDGAFAQEREVLAIEALVRLGRMDAAHARAASFAQSYPQSAHRRRIAVLLGEGEPARAP